MLGGAPHLFLPFALLKKFSTCGNTVAVCRGMLHFCNNNGRIETHDVIINAAV